MYRQLTGRSHIEISIKSPDCRLRHGLRPSRSHDRRRSRHFAHPPQRTVYLHTLAHMPRPTHGTWTVQYTTHTHATLATIIEYVQTTRHTVIRHAITRAHTRTQYHHHHARAPGATPQRLCGHACASITTRRSHANVEPRRRVALMIAPGAVLPVALRQRLARAAPKA